MYTKQLAQMIKESNYIVFFGGAGVSTESGIKDYRSKDGLYNTIKDYGMSPENILNIHFFRKNPDVFYDFYTKYFIKDAEPNFAHKAIAELEKAGKLKAVITQNIDNLHQKAGSTNVLELHGNTREFYCDSCKADMPANEVNILLKDGKIPLCSCCGGVVRPRVVMYGERLYDDVLDGAIDAICSADMLIVGGTSLVVNPAAAMVSYFRGKYFVIINNTETDYDGDASLVIRDNIGEVFKKLQNV